MQSADLRCFVCSYDFADGLLLSAWARTVRMVGMMRMAVVVAVAVAPSLGALAPRCLPLFPATVPTMVPVVVTVALALWALICI